MPLPCFFCEVTGGGSWEGGEAVGCLLPQPFPQTFAASFTFYFCCHGFRILGGRDAEPLPALGGKEAALWQVFCLS